MTQEAEQPFGENIKLTERCDALVDASCPSNMLTEIPVKIRAPLVGDWLKSGDLGFIYASRGIGKSWMALYLAKGMANGSPIGPWPVHATSRVLYLDGEMAPEDLQARNSVLGEDSPALVYINHELLFDASATTINLASLDWQNALLAFCKTNLFSVLFIDNLSTLCFGLDENKALDWEKILPWLLSMRRAQITVIIVHHAGRNNQMRGTSKREDPAFWIMRLDEVFDSEDQPGAHFISRFTKWRNAQSFPTPYQWQFAPNGNNNLQITFKEASPFVMFINWVESGLDTCSDIAQEMGVSKGLVSRWAKKAASLGRIQIVKRHYFPKEA